MIFCDFFCYQFLHHQHDFFPADERLLEVEHRSEEEENFVCVRPIECLVFALIFYGLKNMNTRYQVVFSTLPFFSLIHIVLKSF